VSYCKKVPWFGGGV